MMNSTKIQNQLEQRERELSELSIVLDSIVEEYQLELPGHAATWIRSEVERHIHDHPKLVQDLGVERLRDLKASLADLTARLPSIVAAEMRDPSKWPHRSPSAGATGRADDEQFFDRVFRNTISHVGSLLDTFGLLDEPHGHYPSWEKKGNGQYRYAINPGLDQMKVASIGRYFQTGKQLDGIQRSVEKLRGELAQAKAKELWESA